MRLGHMRAIVLAFALGMVALGQEPPYPPYVDIVVLVEDSIAATNLARHTDLYALDVDDRVAVMTFSNKPSVKLALEEDLNKVDRTLRRLDSEETRSAAHLWDAVVKATELFNGPRDPSVRRAIFVVFSAEDHSTEQTEDSVREALFRKEASLSAVTIFRMRPLPGPPRVLQIPTRLPAGKAPAVWGESVPLSVGSALVETFLSAEALAKETGGLRLKSDWDFKKLVEHVRSH